MRFDPNVYTTAASESWRPHWYITHPDLHEVRGVAPGESWGLARSIQPIPSAEEIAALVECERVLRESKRAHDTCEDSWYSCGAATGDYECSNDSRKGACDCGADAWNAKVDAALARLDAARKAGGQ